VSRVPWPARRVGSPEAKTWIRTGLDFQGISRGDEVPRQSIDVAATVAYRAWVYGLGFSDEVPRQSIDVAATAAYRAYHGDKMIAESCFDGKEKQWHVLKAHVDESGNIDLLVWKEAQAHANQRWAACFNILVQDFGIKSGQPVSTFWFKTLGSKAGSLFQHFGSRLWDQKRAACFNILVQDFGKARRVTCGALLAR
jgi:hypothetical protein